MSNVGEILTRLIDAPSVSGYEIPARKVFISEAKDYADEIFSDVMGNTYAVVKTGSDKKIMIAAHIDQVGMMVKGFTSSGDIMITTRGFSAKALLSQKVIIHTSKGPIKGVIGGKPPHLDKDEKLPKVKDLVVDIGAVDKKDIEDLGITIGDPISIDAHIDELGVKGSVAGPALDDKACVTAMLYALQNIDKKKLKADVYFVATTQEEVGLRGATVAAKRLEPDLGIALDVTFGISNQTTAKDIGEIKLGAGPVIGIGQNFFKPFVDKIIKIAKEKKIDHQLEPVFGSSGTDAWAIQVAGKGVITALLSIPIRYMHSPVELGKLADIENTGKLLAYVLEETDPAEFTFDI